MTGHARARAGWFSVALLAAALVLAPSAVWPLPVAWCALVVVLAIAPGAWLARRVLPEAPHDARVAVALLLAPFACALVASLVRVVLPEPRSAARVLVSFIALLSAAEALRPRQRASTLKGGQAGWVVAASAAAVILLAHLVHPILTLRSDGAFHVGVVHAVLQGLPPGDPWFAGLPLRYFWGLHAWAANGTALVPGLGPAALLPVSGAFAACSALLAASALAARFGASGRVGALAGVFVLLASAPFVWLAPLARGAFGETRGLATILPQFEAGADAALRALDPGFLHPSLVSPLDKFVVVTPFAWGLAGALVLTWMLLAALAEPTGRHVVGVTLILAAVCALHPVAGVALGLAAACGVLASAATRGASPRTAALLLVAIGLAMVVLLPPLRMFAPSAASGAPAAGLAFSSRALVSVFLGGAVLWPCAALTLRRTGAGAVLPGTMLVVLVLGALVLRLEGDNQSKFLNLAFALASPFAAIGFAALKNPPGRARALLAFGLAAWLPTVAALGWAYAHERSTSADAPSSPPRVLLEMLSQESAPDAWVVDATLDPARGAAPAIPAITGRQLLWSGAFMAKKWGHPAQELARRESVARTLASGQWPTGEDAAWLDRSHHEIWLIAPITRVCDPATTTIVARAGDEQLVRFTRP